jgi:glutathione S-transferase
MSLGNATMTIFGDSISGNCLKVKWVAERLGIPFEWVETRVLDKETRTPEFLALNPAGQVPIVQFGDGRVLAQSNAIILHLAEGSDLIPRDAFDRALMLQWLFWEQYSHEPAIAVLRFRKAYLKIPPEQLDPGLEPRCRRVLTQMNDHLAKNDYFVTGRLTLADIALVAYTRWSHEAGLVLADWPHVAAWVRRIEQDLKIEQSS